jgi:uncharacterized membrane protein
LDALLKLYWNCFDGKTNPVLSPPGADKLLFPLRGLLAGKAYTHAWANFIVMIYLLHGLTAIYALSDERLYALIEIVLASAMFVGCSVYARLRGRELGTGLKKLKDVMAEEKARFE